MLAPGFLGAPSRRRAAGGCLPASIAAMGAHKKPSPGVTNSGSVDAIDRGAMPSQPDQRGVSSAMNEPGERDAPRRGASYDSIVGSPVDV